MRRCPWRRGARRDFGRDAGGAVVVEFAVVVPVMLLMILATFEISKFVQTNNQVVQTAAMTGQMISQLPGRATVSEVQRIWSAAPLIAPEAQRMADRQGAQSWSEVFDVTITSIVFQKSEAACEADCAYEANVAWSVGQTPMACEEVALVGEDDEPAETAVPEALVREGSALLIQTSLPYQPYLTGDRGVVAQAVQALDTRISETGWFQPRNASRIVVEEPADASTDYRLCPEYNR